MIILKGLLWRGWCNWCRWCNRYNTYVKSIARWLVP